VIRCRILLYIISQSERMANCALISPKLTIVVCELFERLLRRCLIIGRSDGTNRMSLCLSSLDYVRAEPFVLKRFKSVQKILLNYGKLRDSILSHLRLLIQDLNTLFTYLSLSHAFRATSAPSLAPHPPFSEACGKEQGAAAIGPGMACTALR